MQVSAHRTVLALSIGFLIIAALFASQRYGSGQISLNGLRSSLLNIASPQTAIPLLNESVPFDEPQAAVNERNSRTTVPHITSKPPRNEVAAQTSVPSIQEEAPPSETVEVTSAVGVPDEFRRRGIPFHGEPMRFQLLRASLFPFSNSAKLASGEILYESASIPNDGVERKIVVPLSPAAGHRFLTTERFWEKYGLTNILMTVAAMVAYAARDDRAILWPGRSPVNISELLDLNETQRLLLPGGVVFADPAISKLLLQGKITKAKKLGENLGYRKYTSSASLADAEFAMARHDAMMNRTRSAVFLIHGDFFLRFPFRYTAPLDLCFFVKRLVFQRSLLQRAESIIRWLSVEKKHDRTLALHLRLEFDVELLVKKASAVKPTELTRFMSFQVLPLIKLLALDSIYVCSGNLKKEIVTTLRAWGVANGYPVYFKQDVPGLVVAGDGSRTTSHFDAAVDVTVMQHAAASIVFAGSTLPLSVLSKRCPSPASASTDNWKRLQSQSTLVQVVRDQHPKPPPSASTGKVLKPHVVYGVFGYDFVRDGSSVRFGVLTFLSCEKPFKDQCFYPNS